jgi:hypothetical protein
MCLTPVVARLSDADRAREPRTLGVIAWFDGNAFGSGQGRRFDIPRPLTRSEERAWREGFTEGRHERVCHSWHGFVPCPGDHPVTPNPDARHW